MLSLKRVVFGIIWFIVFQFILYILIGIILSLYVNFSGQDNKEATVIITKFFNSYSQAISILPFTFALVGSIVGILPGTGFAHKKRLLDYEKSDTISDQPTFGFKDALALLLLGIVIQFGCAIFFGSLFEFIGMQQLIKAPVALCSIGGIAIIITALVVTRMSGRMLRNIFALRNIPYRVVLILIIITIGTVIIESEIDNIQRFFFTYPPFFARITEAMLNQGSLSFYMLIVIAPFTEELIFRGVILESFSKRYSHLKAILLSAFLFSIFHLNPFQMLPVFGAGLLLGWLYIRSGSIWLCVILHSLHNLISFLAFNRYLPFVIPGLTMDTSNTMAHQFHPIWLDLLGILFLSAGIIATKLLIENRNQVQGNRSLSK